MVTYKLAATVFVPVILFVVIFFPFPVMLGLWQWGHLISMEDLHNIKFVQERIEKLKSAYLYKRKIILRTVRRIIRLYTHQNKKDIKLLVQDEITSYLEFF
jgi:HJR/Mrr/RecB family endonuclease